MRYSVVVRVHARIMAKRPEITAADVETAFLGALRSRPRASDPVQWVGVGMDTNGRLLEFIAIEVQPEGWLVYHAMPATKQVLNEVGLGRR